MIGRALIIAGLAALAAPAAAQEPLVVTRELCTGLAEHRPQPDARHRPGVDVQGRPVAPADLEPVRIEPPAGVQVGVSTFLHGPRPREDRPPGSTIVSEAHVGTVAVAPDGRAWFNGQPLYDVELERLHVLCRSLR